MFCCTLAAKRVCLWTNETLSFLTLAIIVDGDELSEELLLDMITSLFSLLAVVFLVFGSFLEAVVFLVVPLVDTGGAVEGLFDTIVDDTLDVVPLLRACFCIEAIERKNIKG